MDIKLKRLHISARLSEETTAFAADIWIDGKKVGYAKNDGRGGETMVDVDKVTREKLAAHGKTLMPADWKHIGGAAYAIDQLVESMAQAKENARYARSIAKMDDRYKARCATNGTHAARFEVATSDTTKETRWWEYRSNETEDMARHEADLRFPGLTNWTVIA